ncbi:MAG: hypothetical protein Q9216_003554 [Gyalolechia sp. 2 TL-2023]
MSEAEVPAAIDTPPIHDLDRRRVEALKVAISLCLCYTLCIAFLRVYIRRKFYSWDDWIALAATVLSLGQYAAEYVAIGNGFGRPIDVILNGANLLAINKANYAGLVLWILALFVSKCAAVVFMSRFAQPGRHRKEILFLLVMVIILGLSSLLALVIDCRVVSSIFYWDFPSHQQYCPHPYQRWQVVAAFDSISEFLMLAVPVDLIWSLQMPSSRKIGIITAFYIRVPVLALTLARNHYVHELLTDPDPGLTARTVVIWQEAELAYSIAAATLMCLKPLVRDFNTSFGLGGEMVRTHAATGYIASNENGSRGLASKLGKLKAYGSGSRYGTGSVVEMDSRGEFSSKDDKNKKSAFVSERRAAERPKIGPHSESKMSTTVTHDPDHRLHDSSGSRGPDDIVVTHRVEQSVHPRNMGGVLYELYAYKQGVG